MYNVKCRIIPDRMEAEDAMQEAPLKHSTGLLFRGEVTLALGLSES